MFIIMYVENTDSKYKTFTKRGEAEVFVRSLAEADVSTQNHSKYLTGIVIGGKSTKYTPAQFDYQEKEIINLVSKK